MTTEDNIRAFLLDPSRRKKITINGIEVDAKIPAGNLAKFLAKKRGLPAVQIERLVEELKYIGFGVVPNDPMLLINRMDLYREDTWGNTLPMFPDFSYTKNEIEKLKSAIPELAETPKPSESGSIGVYFKDEETPKDSGNEPEAPLAEGTPEDWEWSNIPGAKTGREISQLMGMYKKKKMKVALFIRLRIYAPDLERKFTWRCYLELADTSGNLYKDYKHKASPAFCKTVMDNKTWKVSDIGNSTFLYTKPIGNPVIEQPAVKMKK